MIRYFGSRDSDEDIVPASGLDGAVVQTGMRDSSLNPSCSWMTNGGGEKVCFQRRN